MIRSHPLISGVLLASYDVVKVEVWDIVDKGIHLRLNAFFYAALIAIVHSETSVEDQRWTESVGGTRRRY